MVTPSLGLLWRYKKNLWSFSYFPANLAEDKHFSIIHRTENHARSRQPGYSHHNFIMRYHIKYILFLWATAADTIFLFKKLLENVLFFINFHYIFKIWHIDAIIPFRNKIQVHNLALCSHTCSRWWKLFLWFLNNFCMLGLVLKKRKETIPSSCSVPVSRK